MKVYRNEKVLTGFNDTWLRLKVQVPQTTSPTFDEVFENVEDILNKVDFEKLKWLGDRRSVIVTEFVKTSVYRSSFYLIDGKFKMIFKFYV